MNTFRSMLGAATSPSKSKAPRFRPIQKWCEVLIERRIRETTMLPTAASPKHSQIVLSGRVFIEISDALASTFDQPTIAKHRAIQLCKHVQKTMMAIVVFEDLPDLLSVKERKFTLIRRTLKKGMAPATARTITSSREKEKSLEMGETKVPHYVLKHESQEFHIPTHQAVLPMGSLG